MTNLRRSEKIQTDVFKPLAQNPSFKYRHQIKRFVKPLYDIPNFAGTTIAILLKSGKKAWLSSTPKVTLRIIAAGLDRGDHLLNRHFLKHSRVIFPQEFKETDSLQSAINHICECNGLYRAYCIVRSCDDCLVLITCNTSQRVSNYQKFYKATRDKLETTTKVFLDHFISVYIEQLPALACSRFATDPAYRDRVLCGQVTPKETPKLGKTEIGVLYWSAKGKDASEIAIITGLTINTVNTYRRRIMGKLNVSSISQAIYTATDIGLLP